MLIHFNSDLCLKIETDALKFNLNVILSQFADDQKWHLIAFWLRKMISAEQNYEIHDQELLIIIMTFKQWWHYLKNNQYIIEVLMNHNNLCDFMKIKFLNEKQIKWTLKLTVYDFTIIHQLKKSNSVDVLSKCSDYKVKTYKINYFLFLLQQKLNKANLMKAD